MYTFLFCEEGGEKKPLLLDKDKIKNSLTKDDITTILLDLKSEQPLPDRQGNLIYSTVCHNHQGGNHKLYYYSGSQMFYCYTECGTGMDVYELVIKAKETQGFNFSFPEALRYVSRITGKNIRIEKEAGFGKESNKISDWEWLSKLSSSKPKMTNELTEYNDAVLDVIMPYQNHWDDEGIDSGVASKYEVGYYFKKNQIIFPNRDEDGRLIGIRARNLDRDLIESGMKYIPAHINGTLYNFPSMFNLYGFYHNRESMSKNRKAMLVEGEKSVFKNETYYGANNFSSAVCGSNISTWQRDKVLSTGVEEVFIAFDKFRSQGDFESDDRYALHLAEYQKKLLRLAHLFTPFIRVYIIWDSENLLDYNDSPLDKGKGVLEELMKNKIEIHTKDVEF